MHISFEKKILLPATGSRSMHDVRQLRKSGRLTWHHKVVSILYVLESGLFYRVADAFCKF
jgi:hypothetical protein